MRPSVNKRESGQQMPTYLLTPKWLLHPYICLALQFCVMHIADYAMQSYTHKMQRGMQNKNIMVANTVNCIIVNSMEGEKSEHYDQDDASRISQYVVISCVCNVLLYLISESLLSYLPFSGPAFSGYLSTASFQTRRISFPLVF